MKLSGINYWLMADAVVEALILDLLEWLAESERNYEEVMNADVYKRQV